MSKVLCEIATGRKNIRSHIVEAENGRTYYVDTADTFDCGPETMVFPYDTKRQVVKWAEVYKRRYPTMEEAFEGHGKIIVSLEQCI